MLHLPRGGRSPHSTGRCLSRTTFLGNLGYERAREVGLRPDCLRFDRVSLGSGSSSHKDVASAAPLFDANTKL
jgi:hypothetical protein